ncbi:MAG TPA: hypothetical protein VES67_09775 [Vicinamibacterales bacterium]|nr:hypothetical protein [Vicinamibacterales bacterium]
MQRALLLVLVVILCVPPVRFVVLRATERDVDRTTPQWRAREEILSRARVFAGDPLPIASLDLSRVPGETQPLDSGATVSCQYVPKPTSGTTSKFDCRLENGEIVKVKYGHSRERQGEIAATRLLAALGFGADRVTFVNRVRCFGCPASPFKMRKIAEEFMATKLMDLMINYKSPRDFDAVSVERKLEGRAVEVGTFEGWDWRELTLVDAAKGGASPAELDALRLIAIFLGHWDNKSTNQRLVCLAETDAMAEESTCRHPLLMLQDLGATFGPTKVNYEAWTARPIWEDERTCLVHMKSMPYAGILFPPAVISEAGRALLADRLTQLSAGQIHALFAAARFPDPVTDKEPAADLTPWVRTFQDKVRQIAERRCE